MEKIASIQYLRAIAAAGVVAFHAAERTGFAFEFGASGVDLFFVISGFIIWSISERRPKPLGTFMLARFWRILPLYWIATTLTLVGALVGLFPSIQLTTFHVIASYFLIPHQSPTNGLIVPLLMPGWTLTYEFCFYLLFGLVIGLSPLARSIVVTIVLAVMTGLGALFHPHAPILVVLTDPILLLFAAGCWLGAVWSRGLLSGSALGLGALVGANAVAAFFWGDTMPRLMVWGVPAILLVVGLTSFDASGLVPQWPWLEYLGDASYSTYLFHGFAIAVVAKILFAMGASDWIVFIGAFSGSMVGGVIVYALLERPLLSWLAERRLRPHSNSKRR